MGTVVVPLWRSSYVEVVSAEFEADTIHARTYCPHFQYWLVKRGEWRAESSEGDHLLRRGRFIQFNPFQKCRKIALDRVYGIGIRVFEPESGSESSRRVSVSTLWQIAALSTSGAGGAEIDETALSVPTKENDRREPAEWLKVVETALTDDPAKEWSLQELADLACVSPNHLCSEFNRNFGVTMTAFRRQRMLELAAESLTQKGRNPETGFYDASHFNRACQSEWGIRATQLKQILQS